MINILAMKANCKSEQNKSAILISEVIIRNNIAAFNEL